MPCGPKAKIAHSRSDALRALASLRLKMVAEADPYLDTLCVYRCSFCNRWHVGHDRRKKPRES